MQIKKSEKKKQHTEENLISAVLQNNEKRVNKFAVYLFLTGLIIVILAFFLNELGVFKLKSTVEIGTYIVLGIDCMIPIIACRIKKLSQPTLKWINLLCSIFFVAWMNYTMSYYAVIAIAVPLVFAAAYFSERTTVITYLVSVVAIGCSTFFGSFGYALLDSNHVYVPNGTVLVIDGGLKQTLIEYGFRNLQYTEHLMVLNFIPILIVSLLLIVLAIAITRLGYDMLVRQAKYTAEKTKTAAELMLAGELQVNSLPRVADINGKYNFEIAASMTAAKEACGDFYDFTMIDETHLALVIADVCGKGIPAAMFMMSAKENLRSAFSPGKTPGEILYDVNNRLFANNTKRMFVTLWLGIIDITTGKMISANGGHENPIIRKAMGAFTLCQEKHGIALGVRKDKSFPNQTYQFEPGDILIQYTDGVTEARCEAGEMYGQERLADGLNEKFRGKRYCAEEINNGINSMVADFVGAAEQTDDITTLVFRFL